MTTIAVSAATAVTDQSVRPWSAPLFGVLLLIVAIRIVMALRTRKFVEVCFEVPAAALLAALVFWPVSSLDGVPALPSMWAGR